MKEIIGSFFALLVPLSACLKVCYEELKEYKYRQKND